MTPAAARPPQFDERIRKDYDRWLKVVKEAKLKPESQ